MSVPVPVPGKLGQFPLFAGLPQSGLELFADLAEAREAKQGVNIFAQGDLGRDIFVVEKGRLGVYRSTGQREVQLAVLGRGDFFGEMAFIDMQPRAGTVRCEEDSALWRWSFAALRASYQSEAKSYTLLVMNIAREISRRLRRADEVILANNLTPTDVVKNPQSGG